MKDLDAMGKNELRDACKSARVKNYGKMSVATMRAALAALKPTAVMETTFTNPPSGASIVVKGNAMPKRSPLVVRNGITKPREGGICRRVWDWLDDHVNATAAELRAWAESEGLNVSNAQQEASRSRKFNGIARAKEVKAA